MQTSKFFGPALLAIAACLVQPAAAGAIYKLGDTVKLDGKSPSWDYLSFDASRDYLFLGRRAAGVTIFDVAKKSVVGTVENSQGANSATLVPEFDRGFTTNGDGTSTIFELSSLKTLDRVKLSDSADNAFYDGVTKQLVFTMGDSKELAFVDAKTGALKGKLGMAAEELEGVTMDGEGNAFVNERDVNKVAKVDIAKRTVVAEYPITGCEQPTGMAIDTGHKRLFIGCKGEKPVLSVMNYTNGKVVAQEPIGRGNDGVVYDADTRRVYAACGIDGLLIAYDQAGPDSYKLAQALTTRPIARTLTIDPKTKKLYSMTAQGSVDPAKKRNMRAGAFYPNTFFDDTMTLLEIAPTTQDVGQR